MTLKAKSKRKKEKDALITSFLYKYLMYIVFFVNVMENFHFGLTFTRAFQILKFNKVYYLVGIFRSLFL